MSRVQSFTSMVVWRKSECCNVLKKLNLTFDMLIRSDGTRQRGKYYERT